MGPRRAFSGMRIGQLARRAGVTVRALHHYDHIGLVSPSVRTGAGHRLYGRADLRRLTAVMALRGMGLSLAEIGAALGGGGRAGPTAAGLGEVIAQRTAALEREIAALRRARVRLKTLMGLMQSAGTVSAEECLELLETLAMIEGYYTPEQLEELRQRRGAVGPEVIAAAEKEWPELMAKMKAEFDAKTDPGHPRVQALARRWKELVESFTGGNPGVAASLGKLWKEKGTEMAREHKLPFDPGMFEYVRRAQAMVEGTG